MSRLYQGAKHLKKAMMMMMMVAFEEKKVRTFCIYSFSSLRSSKINVAIYYT